jgi:hypothetical protein
MVGIVSYSIFTESSGIFCPKDDRLEKTIKIRRQKKPRIKTIRLKPFLQRKTVLT